MLAFRSALSLGLLVYSSPWLPLLSPTVAFLFGLWGWWALCQASYAADPCAAQGSSELELCGGSGILALVSFVCVSYVTKAHPLLVLSHSEVVVALMLHTCAVMRTVGHLLTSWGQGPLGQHCHYHCPGTSAVRGKGRRRRST